MFLYRLIAATLCALLLAGCTSLPADRGQGDVRSALSARGLSWPAADAVPTDPTRQWLGEPLTLDRAIQIALLHNPELQAETAQLGLASADVYEAGRLANPLLSATWLSSGGEPHAQLTLGIALNFTDLLFVHARTQIAGAQFDSAKLTVGNAALDLASQVEAAYRRVAAADSTAQLQATLAAAAQASATLAQRYADAGNLKPRDLALEQAAAAQAALDADHATLDASLARGDLARLLGVGGDAPDAAAWSLAEPLALPVASEAPLPDLLKLAKDSRLDLAAARRHADAVARRYGLSHDTRLLGNVEIGAEREREYDGGVHAGPSVSVPLPIFDWGRGRLARGEAELQIAEAAVRSRELDVERDVKAADARMRGARDAIERYRTVLIPAREQAVEQTQREFNFMLVDVFELLAARQQGFAAYRGYIDALRDYWTARAELARAVGHRLPDATTSTDAARFQPELPAMTPADPHTAPMGAHHEH